MIRLINSAAELARISSPMDKVFHPESASLFVEFSFQGVFDFLTRKGYAIGLYDGLLPVFNAKGMVINNEPRTVILAIKDGYDPVGRLDSEAIINADFQSVFLREVTEACYGRA